LPHWKRAEADGQAGAAPRQASHHWLKIGVWGWTYHPLRQILYGTGLVPTCNWRAWKTQWKPKQWPINNLLACLLRIPTRTIRALQRLYLGLPHWPNGRWRSWHSHEITQNLTWQKSQKEWRRNRGRMRERLRMDGCRRWGLRTKLILHNICFNFS
jgi:hypothetical protein